MKMTLAKKIILTIFFSAAGFAAANAQIITVGASKTASKTATATGQTAQKKTGSPPSQTADVYVRPTAKQRFRRYLNSTTGTGLIGVGTGAR